MVADSDALSTEIARHIWQTKYQFVREDTMGAPEIVDHSIGDTWRRVARAVAAGETRSGYWADRFYQLLTDFKFLPGGRILAGAGTARRVTLCNCFVMGPIEDGIDPIFAALREGALTMQAGGGVGYDFSTLRPAGSPARQSGNIASGPVSFMRIWDSMCATICSTGSRRGAMMATLRCDHPDIEAFVEAKADPQALTHFNCSVLISDEFMRAVHANEPWPLVFPSARLGAEPEARVVQRVWPGTTGPVACRIVKQLPARDLWRRIMRAAYQQSEPGVLFIDRINRENNLGYCERLHATNPCGEIPLPAYGACDLGSFNLTAFVNDPFSDRAAFDFAQLTDLVPAAVRLLDNVIDVSDFPLAQQAQQARASRRIGLGFTGLADALIMLGLHYASAEGRGFAARVMATIRETAYRASVALAREKGPFPELQTGPYLDAPGIRRLPEDIRSEIARHGVRNSHLTAIAPAGTISLLANNVSSGIEPVFAASYERNLLDRSGNIRMHAVQDFACRLWQDSQPAADLPPAFVSAPTLTAMDHLAMQAAVQPHVDHAISKTVNVAADIEFDDFQDIYLEAYRLGLKGCTTFRPGARRSSVLATSTAARPEASQEGSR